MNWFTKIFNPVRKYQQDNGPLGDIDQQRAIRQALDIIDTMRAETPVEQEQGDAQRLMERYRTIFENSIIGLSFYSPEGKLLTANKVMREICHFDSDEGDAFFSEINLFDIKPFNEILDRHHVEEYWACSLSIIPERNMHVYLDIRVHPVLDSEGRLICISVAANDVTAERDMYFRVKENDRQLQKMNKAIQNYEHELCYMMENCQMQAWRISLDRQVLEFYHGLSTVVRSFTLDQLRGIFVNQEDDFVRALEHPEQAINKPLYYIGQMYPVVSLAHQTNQWVQINSIPEYDDTGRLIGAFGVWRNINSLMQKQEELKRETQRARESDQMKSVFLANMTHEIRTPLNAIVGFSDALPLLSTKEEKQEIVRVIMNNCDMLLRLINDILTASTLESGGVQIEKTDVDFAKTFEMECESLRQRVQEPGVEFLYESPYEHLVIHADDGRIRQILTNFVTNAVKYTHQGYIKVGYGLKKRDNEEGLYVYCEDTGEGIAKEKQSHIFDRFFKVNDYVQGTGLGLSISKAIADACHGSIGVESEGEGHGSTFWVWLPCEVKQQEKKSESSMKTQENT